MRSICVALLAIAWSALNALAVEVEGSARLSNGESPEGIRVIFAAASPSARTDTAYTDARGQFDVFLEIGWYRITYGRSGYAMYDLQQHNITTNRVLPQVVLMPPLGGRLVGVLGPGDFQVRDSLYVPDGETARILPGTRLFFERIVPFRVEGQLLAVGTHEDSILFGRRYNSGFLATWRGITFHNADPGTELRYVIVEHATKPTYVGGGGLLCQQSPAHITRSTFRHNHADYGGGLFLVNSGGIVDSCVFFANEANGGGGLGLSHSSAYVTNCLFEGNDAQYSGGGVYTGEQDSSGIYRCRFVGNGAFDGAGLAILNVPTVVSECLFLENVSARTAGILTNGANGARITRCTITRSAGPTASAFSSVTVYGGAPLISSVILSEYAVRFGVLFSSAQATSFRYSDIWIQGGDPIGYSAYDSTQGPPGIGIVDTINAIGDYCDGYLNIFYDPEFMDAQRDFTLSPWSPCINTGDPHLPPDPDGTTADMGAFYRSMVSASAPRGTVNEFALAQNYPNPFNSATRISFDLPRATEAKLAVYDLTGRRVATLLSGPLAQGRHDVNWDAAGLPSGVYLYRLEAPGFAQSRKLMLLR